MTLFYPLREFFQKHPLKNEKILLALSGGPDSMALFYALLEFGYRPIIAHVDHGWREESAEEARALEEIVLEYELPFHLQTLEGIDQTAPNLEDRCRNERLAFFKQLYDEHSCSALLLAHHADDRMETVLKRLFEGSSQLNAMPEETQIDGMRVLRPFLRMNKVDLISWLDTRDIPYLEDSSNQNERFLRARMRRKLIPTLEEQFGKKIGANLNRFADRMGQIEEYFSCKIETAMKSVVEGPLGIYVPIEFGEVLEVQHLIQALARKLKLSLSKDQVETLIELILSKASNKRVVVDNLPWIVDRGYLFILREDSPELVVSKGEVNQMTWKDLWPAKDSIQLPDESFEYRFVDQTMRCINGKSLKDWYNENKVPTFIREKVGVLVKDEKVVHDYLTGRELLK